MEKPGFCSQCPVNPYTVGYIAPRLTPSHELIVLGGPSSDDVELNRPHTGLAGKWLTTLKKAARIDKTPFNVINTVGCHWPDETLADRDEGIRYCREHHLAPVLDSKDWIKVLAFGEDALSATTPRRDISVWRGSPLPLRGKFDRPRVMPTLGLETLDKGTDQVSIMAHDLRKTMSIPREDRYNLYATVEDVLSYPHRRFVFDFEWDRAGNVTLVGVCGAPGEVLVTDFSEPFQPTWKKIFEAATDLYGHNIISADSVYFAKWDWNITAKMWDTMLMQHVIQPDYRHGLAFVSSIFTSRPFWKGTGDDLEDSVDGLGVPQSQWRTWNTPHAIPRHLGGYGGCTSEDEAFRLYNARDNAGNFDIIAPIEHQLERYNMKHIYWNVSRPVAYICRDMRDRGFKIDHAKLDEMSKKLDEDIARLEPTLPEGLRPYDIEVSKQREAPPDTYRPARRICQGLKGNNTSHDPVDIVFEVPDTPLPCPVCGKVLRAPKLHLVKRIPYTAIEKVKPWNSADQVIAYARKQNLKMRLHPKTKQITSDKNTRKAWGYDDPAFKIIDKLKTLSTMRNGFAKEGLRKTDRMHFNTLVHGTGEARLSSSGVRRGIDLNVQNIPKAARKIFIPDHEDWAILSADLSQAENIMTAWLAKDFERLERIHTPGYDEHADLATRIFNVDCGKGSPNAFLRQVGKKINHTRNYGGGAVNILDSLITEGHTQFTLADTKEFIAVWRKMNQKTAEWQDMVMKLAARQGYLENVFGRRRWFQMRDAGAKALAFLPASTVAECVLRMMIALYLKDWGPEIESLGLVRACNLPAGWDLRVQVHDDLTSQGPVANLEEAAHLVNWVMTQPWPQLDGFQFDVEVQYSVKSWGELCLMDNLKHS